MSVRRFQSAAIGVEGLIQIWNSKHLNKAEIFYLLGLFLYEVSSILGISLLAESNTVVPKAVTLLKYSAFALVIIKIIMISYDGATALSCSALIMVGMITAQYSFDSKILDLAIMVVGARKVDFNKICKVLYTTAVAVGCIVVLSSLLGFVDNATVVSVTESGATRIRRSFGFASQNGLGATCLAVCSSYVLSHREKQPFGRALAFAGVALVLLLVVDTRTAAYSILIMDAMWLLIHRVNSRVALHASLIVCLLCVFAGVFLPFAYEDKGLFQVIDGWLSGRLSCASWFLGSHDIPPFGQEIHFLSTQDAAALGLTASVLDNAYIHLLLHYGVLSLIAIVAVYGLLVRRAFSSKDALMCSMVALICVLGMLETWLFMPSISVLLMATYADFPRGQISNGNVGHPNAADD
ncbi:hypothetical protein [Olsenella sp. An188]|uniref:hypothetical protein n=1 Tax=Olsenella sp. An188 TaxID=1965579 RepID=UPI00117C2DBA|nr:hypothetical protein [Olsenella sp. An188]